MKCEAAERELSGRLDGETDPRLDTALREHLATCVRCRSFETAGRRLRDVTRLEPAGPVPDLVPAIMAEVRRETGGRRLPLRWQRPAWGRYAAAFAAAAAAAALVVGGLPLIRPGPAPALATEIPRRIAEASGEVTAYRATFQVVEHNYHPRVPRRTFVAEVSFRAPERFRARVIDTTSYPSAVWPSNDIRLEVDQGRWLLSGPATCPREAEPACAAGGRESRRVVGREPFDGEASLPTDIVLPVRTLAGTDRVRVVRQAEVAGRRAVVVELAYRDATPLFSFLQAGGSWRPFFFRDRVLVSLDAGSWFPLAYEVRAAGSLERDQWAQANALPPEPAGSLLFRAEATSLRTDPGPLPALRIGSPTRDDGFRDLDVEELAGISGYEALIPADLQGMSLHRAGMFEIEGRTADETLLSFTRGLSWLKIRQTRTWDGEALFGDVGELAAPVRLGDGVAYYEPATATLGRRLSIHARGWDLYLESNLPRPALLTVARSLPVRGLPAPPSWLDRVDLDTALARAPYLLLPSRLPDGYRVWTARLVEPEGATVYLRRPGAELDGGGIRIHQAPGAGLSPPLDPEVIAVSVRGTTGRYSPARGELEWVEGGVYRSIGGMALDLTGLVSLAESMDGPE